MSIPLRFLDLPKSSTVAATARAAQLASTGKSIIDLSSGDPNFATPRSIANAAIRSIRKGDTHYTAPQGIIELRAAIAEKLERENGLVYAPEQILVTPSGKFALYAAMATCLNPGDEIIIPSPAWVSFAPMAQLLGAKPIKWRLSGANDFAFSFDTCATLITAKTKAILVNSPHNPTGRVLNRSEAECLMNLSAVHGLTVISDEIYERIIFDDYVHISPASINGGISRTLTVNGFSKSFAMTGWRLGYIAGPRALIDIATRFQEHTVTCATSFVQWAGIEALRDSKGEVEKMRAKYQERRDIMVTGLNAIRGVHCATPQGAFYVFPHFDETMLNGQDAATWLLDSAGVAGVSGSAFDSELSNFVRLSIASSEADLRAAIRAIARAG